MCYWRASGRGAEHVISCWWSWALQALAKGQMSNAESPWLPEATEPTLEASVETWQHGVQQQQEPHVFWAPALCLHTGSALPAQQSPMGSRFPMVTLAPTQTSPLLHSPTALALLHKHTLVVFPLFCLSEAEGFVRKCVTPTECCS